MNKKLYHNRTIFSMSSDLQHRFKMILLGEHGSGKTSLFHRIIYNTFEKSQERRTPSNDSTTDHQSSLTTRYENRTREVRLSGDNRVNVTVFDTGGEERVNYMTLHYYENAQIVCLVYAVNSLASLTSLTAWVEDAHNYLALKAFHSVAKPVYALVGVKGDIPLNEREVKPENVEQAARDFEIPEDCCFEVSNVSGNGIEEMVQQLAQKALNLHNDPTGDAELEDYSSVKFTNYISEPPPTGRSSRWKQCLCCLCCFKCRRRNYERITY